MGKLETLTTIILWVFGVAALLGWASFRAGRLMDRSDRDPRYRRRLLILGSTIYVLGIVAGVAQVVSGSAPPITLLGLTIPLLFVWFFLRAGSRTKIPPE